MNPKGAAEVTVREMQAGDLDAIVRIHQATLGYTFNSRLGASHLAAVYASLARQDSSYVAVATTGGRPVGVVSGTADLEGAKSALMRSVRAPHWIRILSQIVAHPSLIHEWSKGNQIGRPVYMGGEEVRAILTTIAVDPGCQGMGIGRRLVEGLESFFSDRGVHAYRLDTLIENASAREFYKRLGFVEAGVRADSIVLVKKLG